MQRKHKRLCCKCRQRVALYWSARFRQMRWDRHHPLCAFCFRALRQRLQQSRQLTFVVDRVATLAAEGSL